MGEVVPCSAGCSSSKKVSALRRPRVPAAVRWAGAAQVDAVRSAPGGSRSGRRGWVGTGLRPAAPIRLPKPRQGDGRPGPFGFATGQAAARSQPGLWRPARSSGLSGSPGWRGFFLWQRSVVPLRGADGCSSSSSFSRRRGPLASSRLNPASPQQRKPDAGRPCGRGGQSNQVLVESGLPSCAGPGVYSMVFAPDPPKGSRAKTQNQCASAWVRTGPFARGRASRRAAIRQGLGFRQGLPFRCAARCGSGLL